MSDSGPLVRSIDDALASLSGAGDDVKSSLARLRKQAVDAQRALDDSRREIQTLSNLYLAHVRLFEQPQVDKVVEAISEVIINFVGSEDFALYVKRGEQFTPTHGMGVAFKEAKPFRLGQRPLGEAAADTEPRFGVPGAVVLTSLVNLRRESIGFLELRSLLRHKPRLTLEDRELISMLRNRAGVALEMALERNGRSP